MMILYYFIFFPLQAFMSPDTHTHTRRFILITALPDREWGVIRSLHHRQENKALPFNGENTIISTVI